MKQRFPVVALAVAAALTVPAAAAPNPSVSERYGYSTFRTQTGRVDLLVDGYPASLHPEDAYVPIPVAVVQVVAGKSIPLTPESFRLIDDQGNAVPAASYRELVRNYGKMSFDRSMLYRRPLTLGPYYATFFHVRGAFYPPPGRATRVLTVDVPPYGLFRDVLYFPMPPAGLNGVLTLDMKVPHGPSARVKFVASTEGFAALETPPKVKTRHGA